MADPGLYSLSLEQLTARLKVRIARQRGSIPAFTLLLGSGFSHPIIPTAGAMLGDIAWWLYRNEKGKADGGAAPQAPFGDRPAEDEDLKDFEGSLWKAVHEDCQKSFELLDGIPGGPDPTNTGKAYRAIMSGRAARGLSDPQLRRRYLRAVGERAELKVNGAHIYLAGILRAQETWSLGGPFCRTIFTTNFDPLLQRSLQLVNKLYYMTDRPEVLEPPEDDDNTAIHLVYSHGSLHRYLLLNTDHEILAGRMNNAASLVPYFERHGVLVIGYSGWNDAIMEALKRCRSFDGNLYWCGIHSPAEAPKHLSPDVLEFLRSKGDAAFYVPIPGANEAMLALHRDLGLGETPAFIVDPIAQVLENLGSINVSPVTRETSVRSLDRSLNQIVERTRLQLEAARDAFHDPGRLDTRASREVTATTTKAVVAKCMNDALAAAEAGEHERAIRLWGRVIDDPKAAVEERSAALLNRGVTYGELGKTAKEIADYTAAWKMARAPLDHRTQAMVNRAVTYGEMGKRSLALADYDRVIDMRGAPAEQKAQALVYRGVTKGERGEVEEELKAYQRVIEMAEAPAEQKAQALLYRGYTLEARGEVEPALADYDAIVALPQIPAEEKAYALLHRAFLRAERGDPKRALADYNALLALAEAPSDARIAALNNRALLYRDRGRLEKAVQDYSALLEIAETPAADRADAYGDRAWLHYRVGDLEAFVADSRAALALAPRLRWVRFNLALGLLLNGDPGGARAEYLKAANQSRDVDELADGIADLEEALQTRPDLPDAPAILSVLRARQRSLTPRKGPAQARAQAVARRSPRRRRNG